MPIIIDIRKDLRFKQGREEGIAQGIARGITKGIARGKTEGKEEMRLAIAKNMLREGVHALLVQKCTGLPLAEVLKLADKFGRPGSGEAQD